ncbi:hypothetical protein SAMN02745664_12110 [Moraxella cuniculi DSM 21768]|uniref:Uncharacterized protein n=1 Tax=Moraxella cuniculi DSM 21768 TaxID=1122245 RepID=A0A1N7G0N6_9GAMM|nr:hypothetical protein [Moraxella cuniculi]OOS07791.1 hypothetical protein B0189_01915 [Moraxella cuniculi]SIS06121.1 hypothetical protein SAMN02745664_12110 [Moraxella cuniculi DSM 21768]
MGVYDERVIQDAITALMPDIDDDKHDDSIKQAFKVLLGLEPSSFMGIHAKQSNTHLPNDLKEAFESYKGRLSDKSYQFRAFIASLYDLDLLDVNNITYEWQWLAKICHFLVYFATINTNDNRIESICRMARLWHHPSHAQHELWGVCHQKLQARTLTETHQNFTHYLNHLTTNKAHKSVISQFHIPYRMIAFAHNQQKKIHRKFHGKQTKESTLKPRTVPVTIEDDDSDTLVEIKRYETTAHDIDINREKLDNTPIDFILIKQDSLRVHESYSAAQMHQRMQAKFHHTNQNEMFLSTSLRYLSIYSIQALFAKLWQYFLDPSVTKLSLNVCDIQRSVALLLLSLYTGRTIFELLTDIEQKSCGIVEYRRGGAICRLIVRLDITPSRIKTGHVHKVLANQSTVMHLPLPSQLIKAVDASSADYLDDVIRLLKQELNMPVLSKGRIQTALYGFMSRNVCTSQIASIITGRNLHKRADLWYCSVSQEQVFTYYQDAIKTMAQGKPNGIGTSHLNNSVITNQDYIGSQNCPNYALATKFFDYLRQEVIGAKSFIDKFNAYNLWLWHIFLLLTSMRAVDDAPGLLNQFNLDANIAWISDKEGRNSSDSQRLVPICDFLLQAIQDYLAYLKQCQRLYGKLSFDLQTNIHQILNSQRPLLNLMDEHFAIKSLSPGVVRQNIHQHFRFKEDWTRHLGQKYLHESSAQQSLILSVFGHEMSEQESWHKHSSMSVNDIMGLKEHYQGLACLLKLEQIHGK